MEDNRLVFTVPEVARLLRIGRSAAYELCRQRLFPIIRLGRSVRVPKDAFLTWLTQR